MSINNKRSYTEYTVTQPTTDFAIGFDDFDEGSKDNILVTLNGVLVESLGYAAIRKNESTVSITPAITEGTVRLTRETDIDEPFHKFTAGALFSAKSMDENFQQVRHSQQEVRDGFEYLEFNTSGIVSAAKVATNRANDAADEVIGLTAAVNSRVDAVELSQEATVERVDNFIATDVVPIVNDAINNTAVEGGVLADTFVTVTSNLTGSVARNQRDKNSETLSIKDFGIKGDGTDESAKLRAAIAAIPKKGKLDFLGLDVSVNSSFFITKSHFILENGSIKALSTMVTNTEQPMMRLIGCEWFALNHFTIDANRQERTPAEKSIHSLHMRSCKNFALNYVSVPNAVCDGLYFDSSTALDKATRTSHGVFNHCNFDNAYRNNVSIIVGADLEFNNCKFRDANGTLPMAGVDLETNQYGVDGLIENITFNRCEATGNNGWQIMVTSHDNPKNIRINGGVITSNKGQAVITSIGNTGGVLVSNDTTYLEGVMFKGGTKDSGYAFRTNPVPNAFANISRCTFIDNYETDIYIHAASAGGAVDNCDLINSGGVNVFGKNTRLTDLRVTNPTGVGISSGTSAQGLVVEGCTVVGAKRRGIYSESADVVLTGNIVKDVLDPVAYIQATGVNATIDDNIGLASVETNVPLLIANGMTARSIQGNNFDNKSSTVDEYSLGATNTALLLSKAKIARNKGGLFTKQDVQKVVTPEAIPTCTATTRPNGESLAAGVQIFDLTLSKTITWSGTNWFANGVNVNAQPVLYSAITPLVSVPANSTASQEITMTGVVMGWSVIVTSDGNLNGTRMWGEVTANDKVTVYRRNDTDAVAPAINGRLKIKAEVL